MSSATITTAAATTLDGSLDAALVSPPATAQLIRVPEVMDDFVRNYLRAEGFTATLRCMAVECQAQQQQQSGPTAAAPMVPDNYRETMALRAHVEALELDLRRHAALTTRVTQQWVQAKKERELHRSEHLRAVQENTRLRRLVAEAGQHAESVQPTLVESRARAEQLHKNSTLLQLERDRLRTEKTTLAARVAELEAQLGIHAAPVAKGATGSGNGKPKPPAGQRGSRGKGGRTTTNTAAAVRATSPAAETAKDAFVWPADSRTAGASGTPPPPPSSTAPATAATEWALQASFTAHTLPVTSVATHPSRAVVASGGDDGVWRLSALPSGDAIAEARGHANWISCLAFHPRGTMLATGSGDKTVKLWDFATGNCAATLTAHAEAVWDLDFQDTGLLLVSAGHDRTARVWDVEYGVCRQILRGHQDAVNGARWLPQSNTLVTGSADKCVAVWDARLSTKVQSLAGHRGAVLSVAAAGPASTSPLIASCDTQGALVLWDLRRMSQVLRVECGPQPANCVAMDASARYVAVASDDGMVKMVDLEEGVVAELTGHEGAVQSVVFETGSSSSHYLVSGGSDRTVRYWS